MTGTRRSILVVESKDLGFSLDSLLRSGEFEATSVSTNSEAIDWLRGVEKPPCAIFLHAGITTEQGKDFLHSLERELPHLFESLPVIFAGPKAA